MFTWGPQSSAPAGPPVTPPVASFWAMRAGAASFGVYNAFVGLGSDTPGLSPSEYALPRLRQTSFSAATGISSAQTFESFSDSSVTTINYTDANSGVGVDVAFPSGGIQTLPFTAAAQGRYSVAYYNANTELTEPADGGSKCLVAGGASTHEVTFDFTEPIVAFGLYLVDYMDFGGLATWSFYSGASLLYAATVEPLDFFGTPVPVEELTGSVGFVGHVALTNGALFDRVVISIAGSLGGDSTALDNIMVGTVRQIPSVSVSVGQSVQFVDTSTNSPTAWSWNFGDSTTSTLQNPTKTYSASGTYTVTLTASNAGGSDAETRTAYVQVT